MNQLNVSTLQAYIVQYVKITIIEPKTLHFALRCVAAYFLVLIYQIPTLTKTQLNQTYLKDKPKFRGKIVLNTVEWKTFDGKTYKKKKCDIRKKLKAQM